MRVGLSQQRVFGTLSSSTLFSPFPLPGLEPSIVSVLRSILVAFFPLSLSFLLFFARILDNFVFATAQEQENGVSETVARSVSRSVCVRVCAATDGHHISSALLALFCFASWEYTHGGWVVRVYSAVRNT